MPSIKARKMAFSVDNNHRESKAVPVNDDVALSVNSLIISIRVSKPRTRTKSKVEAA